MEAKTIIQNRLKLPMGFLFTLLMLLPCAMHAQSIENWEIDWSNHEIHVTLACEGCGYDQEGIATYDDQDPDAALNWYIEYLSDTYFCSGCGFCKEENNSDCYKEHHCYFCDNCVDESDFCLGCWAEYDAKVCSSCSESKDVYGHCQYCNKHFDFETGGRCDCEWGIVAWHCEDCSEIKCEVCGLCLVVNGEETFTEGACMEHHICGECLEDGLADDGLHCIICHSCDQEVCLDCGLCEDCYSDQNHCPVCDYCFGFDKGIEWCLSGGEHCQYCCEENEWLCESCGQCVEAMGLEFCGTCGYCNECCEAFSEDEGCTHKYCLESSEYELHLCPSCEKCPDDTECEYCGYCEECQGDYHCEHEICPDSPDWDDHLCLDCGDCFDPDELCEYCGKCESCAGDYHCEHGYCPDGDLDDGDHFVCDQCGECFEGLDRCDYCELCTTCGAATTEIEGCEHDICIESPDFADHWCYEDDQCQEKCDHDPNCAHTNVSSQWNTDGTAHWHVCDDCGAAVEKAIHSEGAPVTITEPDTEKRKNGTASVSCNVCNYSMSVISIPFTPIPEDGSPYIITQPKDYEGKTSTGAYVEGGERYVTFTVRAGGENLSYQWYEQFGTNTPRLVVDEDGWLEGGTTASLKALVYNDACTSRGYYKYYCVVTNSHGSVQTRTALVLAEHSFGHYENNGDGTHSYVCNGECDVAKSTKPHRLGEWELIRPATDTQTGLLRQECMDCGAKSEKVIPKVEPGHQHAYNQPRYNADEHWFACRCGIVSTAPHASHTWGTPVVTEEPTEKTTGSQDVSCTACGFTKTEKLDRLPHTHVWYTLGDSWVVDDFTHHMVPDPKKWGHSGAQHFVRCKTCDQINPSPHTWGDPEIHSLPNGESKGKVYRECQLCSYVDATFYEEGTWPVIIFNGKAEPAAAAPGQTVTITYDVNTSKVVGTQVKFKKWVDNKAEWGGYAIYTGSPSVYLKPLPTLANANSTTTTFVMPDGPVAILATYEDCLHTGGTRLGERLEPTCKSYGHEPDVLCKDCGMVMTEGARIEALGHQLSTTPVSGTEQPLYCTYTIVDKLANTRSDTYPTGSGYAGDFICSRCNQTVKGKRTPIVHKQHYTWIDQYGEHSTVYPGGVEYPDDVTQPTCTTFGLGSDKCCADCHKVLSRSKKIPSLGHEWGEWTTVREATTTSKGREQRVCLHDESHVQTRVTDYSGPDYRLKADKMRLSFEWTYGETPKSQTVAFTSIGRDDVTGLRSIVGTLGPKRVDVAFKGMVMTITPRVDEVLEDQSQKVVRLSSVTYRNTTISYTQFTAPAITVTFKIKKAPVAFSLADDTKTMYAGETEQAPVLSGKPDDVTATWRSSDYSVATVDPVTGEVTARAPGVAVITASYAGDDYHTSSKASYTLIVRGSKMPGDVNNDGTIDISDVTALTNIVLGRDNNEPHVFNHAAADVDDDGSVTNFDVRTLANNILGNNAFMYVEDVFTLTGRTVATGTILRGLFRTGQPIVLRSINDTIPDAYLTINSIEMFRKVVPEAVAGDGVGIVLNVDRDKIGRGDVLTIANNPNVIHSKTLKGTLYLYTKAEGGRHTPITSNYTSDLLIGGVTFSVQFSNLGTIDGATPTMIMPGQTSENIVLEVQDAERTPYAFKGQVVYLRESGRTIGKLTITGQ